MTQQVLTILGSTGSTGMNTLDVISRRPEKFHIFTLAGYRQVEKLVAQCAQSASEYAMIADAEHTVRLKALLKAQNSGTRALHGAQALVNVASAGEVDGVICTIVDAAGLPSALAATQKGKTIYPTNKETLIVSDTLLVETTRTNDARVLPADDEHNAIFQVLPYNCTGRLNGHGIHSTILTASGGPFLNTGPVGFEHITPIQAIKHPDWSVGRRISVDSVTMMNKGLELIETYWLLNCPPDNLEVVIHPQSVMHSMARYLDGSALTQLGNSDMHTPIIYYLGLPEQIKSRVGILDFDTLSALTFRRPDSGYFPRLELACNAVYAGGSMPCVLNAANEVTITAFLDGKVYLTDIARVVAHYLDVGFSDGLNNTENLLALDAQTHIRAQEYAENLNQ